MSAQVLLQVPKAFVTVQENICIVILQVTKETMVETYSTIQDHIIKNALNLEFEVPLQTEQLQVFLANSKMGSGAYARSSFHSFLYEDMDGDGVNTMCASLQLEADYAQSLPLVLPHFLPHASSKVTRRKIMINVVPLHQLPFTF